MPIDVDFIRMCGAAASVAHGTAGHEAVMRRRRRAGSNNGVALAVGERFGAADEGRPLKRRAHMLRDLGNACGIARGGFDRRSAPASMVFADPTNDPVDVPDVGEPRPWESGSMVFS